MIMLTNKLDSMLSSVGKKAVSFVEESGYIVALFFESVYWIVAGRFQQEKVNSNAIVKEAMLVGVQAVPIVSILCFSVGVMLAIQGIESLKIFGAENQVILGVAFSVTREFSPLIIGILVAGRSGSSITAKIGMMTESQEIDALRVIGVSPVRYLVSPVLLAMLIMMPALTVLGDLVGLLGSALYSIVRLDMSMSIYILRTLEALRVDDIIQGLEKSLIFAVLITTIAASNGFQVKGGAEGIGKRTTRSVVLAISSIVMADMLFTYFVNR
jgi:phospholipid/cholesterol/gamma-HCH transport system permease protein